MQVARKKRVFLETWWKNLVFPRKNLHLLSRLLHTASFHVIQQNPYHIHVISLLVNVFMIAYIYIYIILQDIRSASKSLRLCRYLPYSRQQHGCPLVRIHLLSNFVGVAFPSQKIIENMTFLGQKVEEIRETRICPVVSRRKNMRFGAWFLNASHASFFTLEEAS